MPDYCVIAPGHPWHGPYHDFEYGFPLTGEAALLERLSLEIFQAGLSWLIVLKKRAALHAAFEGFAVDRVANYGREDVQRLLADSAIIRNRRKIDAVIANAGVVADLRGEAGGFEAWLAAHHPRDLGAWVKLFKSRFRFVGPEVVGEFLMSIGYLAGAHRADCPTRRRIVATDPPWAR